MNLRKVEADILERLHRYLRAGKPLPTARDRRVSVTGLVRAFRLPGSDARNFYRKHTIRLLSNALSAMDGIRQLGKG